MYCGSTRTSSRVRTPEPFGENAGDDINLGGFGSCTLCSVASNWTNESSFAREQVSIVRQVLESPAIRELIVAGQSPRMCGL
jgi:hypothetical protein